VSFRVLQVTATACGEAFLPMKKYFLKRLRFSGGGSNVDCCVTRDDGSGATERARPLTAVGIGGGVDASDVDTLLPSIT